MRPTTHFKAIVAATAIATVVALAGCTGGSEEPAPPSPPKSAEAVPANPGGGTNDGSSSAPAPKPESEKELKRIEQEMKPSDLNAAQMKAVREYLTVRENSESVKYDGRKGWETALKKITTGAGFKNVSPERGPSESSNAQNVAAANKYEVKAAIGACTITPGYGAGGDSVAAQCDLTDLVVTDSGTLVPSQSVDSTWPYFGPQDPPNMILKKSGSKWLIDGDYTGKAS